MRMSLVSIVQELKRRNVLRMAVLYVVTAWLVVQVAGAMVDLDVLPSETGPWVMVVLAIGFPIALIVSWFWDITPEGVVRESDVSDEQLSVSFGSRRTDFVIIAMLAAAVILLLVWEPPASADDALTVLPFESMTGPDEASFSEGFSIETLSLLSQLRVFKLRDPPATAILALFPDIQTLAKELNVRWILKGSVRKAERRVRVSVKLIDADDDAAIVWSNVFDREWSAENLFAIQREIALSITGELRQSLGQSAEQRLATPPTQNAEAYQAYLLGRQRLKDRHVDWLEDAVDQFARAVELDPDFAGAYSGLVDACHLFKSYSGGHQHQRCPAKPEGLLKLARKAVDLDPELGEAWISLALSLELSAPREPDERLKKLDEAKSAFERGLELNPNQSQGYLWYADNLVAEIRYREGETGDFWKAWQDRLWQSVIARGLEKDPLSIPLHHAASLYPTYAQTPEEAMSHVRRIVEIAPNSPTGLKRLAEYSWSLEGRADEAIRWAHRGAQVDPDQGHYASLSAAAYSALGDFDMALAYLDKRDRMVADEGRKRPWPVLTRGLNLMYAGRIEEAVEILERMQDTVPTHGVSYALNALTSLDFAAGNYDKALSRYESHRERCLEQKDTYYDWWNCPFSEFARTLQATGESDTAARLLESFSDDGDGEVPEEQMEDIGDLFLIGNFGKVFLDAGYGVIRGREDEALERIEKAVHMGFRGYAYTWGDWRFTAFYDIRYDSVRDHPRFHAAMAIIEGDMAQQLENVRAMQQHGEVPTLEELRAEVAKE